MDCCGGGGICQKFTVSFFPFRGSSNRLTDSLWKQGNIKRIKHKAQGGAKFSRIVAKDDGRIFRPHISGEISISNVAWGWKPNLDFMTPYALLTGLHPFPPTQGNCLAVPVQAGRYEAKRNCG